MRRRFLKSKKNSVEPIDITNYLTIEALTDGLTASLASNAVEYCIDGSGDWVELDAGEKTPAINTGQTLSFRANYTAYNTSRRFTISKSCNVSGDPMSLYVGDKANSTTAYKYNYSCAYLFYNCTTIVDASKLNLSRTPKTYTCYYMFYGCIGLTTPPELPATTLASSCYRRMFQGCTALKKSPVLPALTLVSYCYEYMLTSCSKCAEITMLATNISASNCLLGWVNAVKSSGTFYKNKDATWEVYGISGIPSGWTVVMYGEEGGSDSEGYNFSFGLVQTEPGETIEEYGDYSEVFDVMVNLAREIGHTSQRSITVDAVPEEYFISIDGSEEYRIDYYDVSLDASGNPVEVMFYCEYDVFFAMGFFDASYIYFMGAS